MSSTLDAIPRCSAMLAFYLVAATTAAVGSPAVRTVALSGQQAPGAEPGSVFSVFDTEEYGGPALNNLGRTAFIATLAHGGGVDGTNDRGIWSEGSGSLALEVRDGEQAPGTPPGAAFFFLNDPQFNDAGQVAFVGTLAVGAGGATNANNFGVWITSHDSLLYVARAGDAAPGGPPGAVFNGFTNGLTLNESGQLAFQAGVFGGGGGIWLLSGGSLEPVVSSGEYAPGTSVGTTFGGINPPSLSDAGRLAFFSNLAIGADPPTYDEVGIWSGEPGSLGLAARRGAQAPGLPAGAQIDSFRANPLVNVAGNTLFYADLKPGSGGVTAANSGVVYIQRGGSLDLVLRSDRHAPGTPAGTRFEHFGLPFFNADDEVAFRGGLREGFGDVGMNTDNSTGIWAGDPGNLRLVARANSHATGTPPEAVFWEFDAIGPVLNAAGQTAFEAVLRLGMGGVTESNDLGIWAEDRTGVLRLIVREGELFDVDDGPGVDLRTISGLEFLSGSGNGDGRSSGFNDLGQLAFRAIFTDGTEGIFISDLATIPEPATAFLAIAAMLVVNATRRNRSAPTTAT